LRHSELGDHHNKNVGPILGFTMSDKTQRRAALHPNLVAALSLATELGEAVTAYLIERALDEIRAGQFSDVQKTANIAKT
jgi:hypothetical protein